MRYRMISRLAAAFFVLTSIGPAQEVVRCPQNLVSLEERWTWAVAEAERRGFKDAWIGYTIDRLMPEDSWIGSFSSLPEPGETTLYELVTGQRIEFDRRFEHVRERDPRKKVMKELAFLWEFRGDPSDPTTIRSIKVTNVSLTVDLDRLPLLWLGKTTAEQSMTRLKSRFASASSRRISEEVVRAVGLHGTAPEVFDFLKRILTGTGHSSLRGESAFWLGMLDTAAALDVLREIALNDDSHDVSEKAVFAMSQMSMHEATETLIDLGRNAPEKNVRKKAVFWLGQKASKTVIDTLEQFVYDEGDEDVQKHAVFALTQFPENEGVPLIIEIARTHPNPRIRKQAVFWLGECDDPRAFETLVDIARGK